MGFPIGLAVAVARKHVARADEDDRRLDRLRTDPAWIAEETDPEIQAMLDRMRDEREAERTRREIAAERRTWRIMWTMLAAFLVWAAWMAWSIHAGHG